MPQAVLKFLRDILVAVIGNSNLTQQILKTVGLPAQEDTVMDVIVIVDDIQDEIVSTSFGLSAINDRLTDVQTTVETIQMAVDAILAQLTTWDGSGVPLPTTPPTGYGSDPSGTAAAVWDDNVGHAFMTKGWLLTTAGLESDLNSFAFVLPYTSNQLFRYGWNAQFQQVPPFTQPPTALLSGILSTDDLLSWVTRESPLNTWAYMPPGTDFVVGSDDPTIPSGWLCILSSSDFLAIQQQMFPAGVGSGPPIWPGVANVTLGSPVAISSQFTVDGPMDGVIVTITDVTVSKVALAYDSATAYKNIGGLSFFNDNNDQEAFQLLAFNDQSYVPFTMGHAAGVRFRVDPSVVGTVTPWVVV